jgi:hypothetical protein
MFGNKNLVSEGVEASAIVVNAKGYDLRGDYGGYARLHLDLDVHFADGTKATISRNAKTADVGLLVSGDIVPVRYDDNDHSKVEIDTPAMKAHRAASKEALQASNIARAEAELARSEADPTAGPDPTVDELRNLLASGTMPTFDQIRRAGRNR